MIRISTALFTFFVVGSCSLAWRTSAETSTENIKYGVDVSWPMHHANVSTNYPWLPHNVNPSVEPPAEYQDMVLQPLGDVQSRHDAYMRACFDFYEEKDQNGAACYESEAGRVAMLLEQPREMINFTELGYGRARLPGFLHTLLAEFWEKNMDKQQEELWGVGNVHTNRWESPTATLNINDPELQGGGYVLELHVINALRAIMEEWTGQRQAETSVYGIRVYPTGAMLSPHVDRHPLVSSAIINVAQDLDEPWYLEVIGHDGLAHNITQEPGDIIMYESHSIIHGRQFPLKGRYMANIFVHFEPVGPLYEPIDYDRQLPPYLHPDSEEAEAFLEAHPEGYLLDILDKTNVVNDAHELAALGDVEKLVELLDDQGSVVEDRDENGWIPLADAVRNGHVEAVRLLLERGSDYHAVLGLYAEHGSIMWLARTELGDDHPVTQLLEELGAREIEPIYSGEDEL